MNTVLYLVGQANKHTPHCEFFDTMEIMNENDLRCFFKTELELGHIAQKNLDDHDFDDKENIYQMDISEIFSILCDNDEYDEDNTYYVSQQEVEINDEDMYD